MRRKIALIVLFGVSGTCFGYENFGPYVGVGAGRTSVSANFALDETTTLRFDADDSSLKLFAGYRFSRWLAFEVAYTDLGDFSGDVGGDTLTIGYRGVTPWLIGTLPLGRFELLGRLGYFINSTDYELLTAAGRLSGSASNDSLTVGAGVGAMVTRHLNLRLEYEYMDLDDVDDSDALWLSLAWRFL